MILTILTTVCGKYRIAGKLRGVKFSWFSRICPYPQKFNPQNYIYVINNGNWIEIRASKIVKT